MKKTLFIIFSVFVAGVLAAFMMDDDDQRPRRGTDNRISVERVLEATNLNFHKDIGQTSVIFQFAPEDSIKIECEDCILRMIGGEDKGGLAIKLQSIDKLEELKPSSFNRWIRINSSNGKVGIVFERDGVGEKVLNIRSLKVLRKTRSPFLDEGGVPMGLLDVNNLYIDKLTKDNTAIQTTFFFKLKTDDKIKVELIGANGAVPGNLVCSVYKIGEEYDKKPMATGQEINVPAIDGGQDLFGFEFAHIKDVKGTNAYHLDIFRIPLHTAGYRDIKDSIAAEDTVKLLNDTSMVPKSGFYEGPIFQYIGPEGNVKSNIPSRFNLGINKNFRACYDIALSDEGLPAEPCVGCDTFWAFWLGAGNANINRYLFQDSLRKLQKSPGLIEAYARSMKTRGNSLGVFPAPQTGEKVFFAIVNQADKQRFLTAPFIEYDWDGNDTITWSSKDAVAAKQFKLHYTPGSLLSLCVCNQSSLSTVPILFKFQQFLTVPRPKDSVEQIVPIPVPPKTGSLFEVEPSEVQ